jgi:hypothetical protein
MKFFLAVLLVFGFSQSSMAMNAGQLSKRMKDDCGRARTCPAVPAFNSPCRRSQTLRRDGNEA